jgi:hypothetical protein
MLRKLFDSLMLKMDSDSSAIKIRGNTISDNRIIGTVFMMNDIGWQVLRKKIIIM